MASSKPELARAGTMQATAKDGKTFLTKNLTEWKKPYLMTQFEEKNGDQDEAEDEEVTAPAKAATPGKAKLAKHTTMKGTAKEAKALLGGEKLADTRQETKAKKSKTPLKKSTTVAKAVQEAKVIYGDLNLSGERQLRKRSASDSEAKPSMKRAGTMQNTAKEGKDYLKRGKKAKKAAKTDSD